MEIVLKKFSTDRSFGVELEVSNNVPMAELVKAVRSCGTKQKVTSHAGWVSTDTGSGWQVKMDSTCGPQGKTKNKDLYGFEVASYVASGLSGLIDIGNAATALKAKGAEVNRFCGMHVHTDARDLNQDDVGKIMANWIKMEHILYQACPKTRRANKYCKPLLKKFKGHSLSQAYTAKQVWQIAKPMNLNVHDNSEKKYSFNTVGFAAGISGYYGGKQTLELRMPEGTLEKRDVKNWTRLFVHFVSEALTRKIPSDLNPVNVYQTLQILGLQGFGTEFYVLSEGLYETKIWFLDRICKYSSSAAIKREARKILAYIS